MRFAAYIHHWLISSIQATQQSSCDILDSDNPYSLGAPGVSDVNYNLTSVTFYVDSQQPFIVYVKSRNNNGVLSSWAMERVTAPLLRKNILPALFSYTV